MRCSRSGSSLGKSSREFGDTFAVSLSSVGIADHLVIKCMKFPRFYVGVERDVERAVTIPKALQFCRRAIFLLDCRTKCGLQLVLIEAEPAIEDCIVAGLGRGLGREAAGRR